MQDAEAKLYRLGPLAFELGLASRFHADVVELCRPHIRALSADTGFTIMVSMRAGMETVCLDRADGADPLEAKVAQVGERLLLGVGTGGVLLLAAMSDAEIEEILTAPGYVHSPVTRDEIRTRVARAREQGFADISDKPIPGVRGIGVVVRSDQVLPSLSLSIVGTHARLNDANLAPSLRILRMTAERIGAAFDLR
ncbi:MULTISPECIES: IclR family transcriptional regulator [unclassified Haematobacter]|uniref:IclR family transcriptional regulator n=1 Tax=unclassified Haematobacter TaxID=2640585 RepID=UPI0025BED394|nr:MULTISPECIES: IclR family transcriptional regulator C-terminal domain-containing protein [unclassified Haematobacter]